MPAERVRFMSRHVIPFVAVVMLFGLTHILPAQEGSPSDLEFFESKIRPVLVRECYDCHSHEAESKGKLRGKLLLDTRDGGRTGGESGPAIVPGKPEESLLIQAIKHVDLEMPPKGKLPDDTIANFEKWVRSGAVDPRDGKPSNGSRTIDHEAARDFWAFRPLVQSTLPAVNHPEWVRSPIDHYILAQLESRQITPNSLASPHTLVRRAYLDLTGLPPTLTEHDFWVSRLTALASPGAINTAAWAELIDSLLGCPQYGERWARHWMDVARFAESHGYEQDYDRPTAYHYRDFLIRAFNEDMPYDQFVRWQLAGDELSPQEPLAWMATGFLAAGVFPTQLTEAEFESTRYDELDDIVATTGVAFLGLSVGCARCHDHKFDPITSHEYYQLVSTFGAAVRAEKPLDLEPENNATIRSLHTLKLAALREQLERMEQSVIPPRLAQWLIEADGQNPPGDDRIVRQGTSESSATDEASVGNADIPLAPLDAIQRLRPIARAMLSAQPQSAQLLKSHLVSLAQELSEKNADDWQPVNLWFRQAQSAWRDIQQALENLESSGPPVKLASVLVSSEGLPHLKHHADDRGFPHFYPETYELRRGDVHQKGEVASPGMLQVLTGQGVNQDAWRVASTQTETTVSYRRSALAKWMTDPQKGAGTLAARVIVNRLWQHHFGRGIVSTPNDFGAAGERPTHPELLDWLAGELIEGGWKLKRLHKLIMTSSMYMQSSDPHAILSGDASANESRMRIDPENRYWWRRSPQRLEAEAIRDSMLAVASQLDDTLYGPGTLDESTRRRSLYFFIKRSQLIPTMMLFDWPEHLVSIGQRTSTTTAPQALMFMNSPLSRQMAESLASKIQTSEPREAIVAAYQAIFFRAPDPQELDLAEQFFIHQREVHHAACSTESDSSAFATQVTQDALADLCQTLLGSNEFIYVD